MTAIDGDRLAIVVIDVLGAVIKCRVENQARVVMIAIVEREIDDGAAPLFSGRHDQPCSKGSPNIHLRSLLPFLLPLGRQTCNPQYPAHVYSNTTTVLSHFPSPTTHSAARRQPASSGTAVHQRPIGRRQERSVTCAKCVCSIYTPDGGVHKIIRVREDHWRKRHFRVCSGKYTSWRYGGSLS